MRLIDADDLFSEYVSVLSKHIAEFKLGDAIEMLEDAPTIDAIPIEWLEKYRKQAKRKNVKELVENIIRLHYEEQFRDD